MGILVSTLLLLLDLMELFEKVILAKSLLEHSLFVPSTFEEAHFGAVHRTFCSPDGLHETRIDYIALPSALTRESSCTWVAEDIDLCGAWPGHFAVLCQVHTTVEGPGQVTSTHESKRINRCDLHLLCRLHGL